MMTSRNSRSIGALLLAALSACALADDSRRRQLAHDHAVDLVTEIVSETLRSQLEQFEVNGLQEQPIYLALRASEANLRELVGNEMTQLKTMLNKSEVVAPADVQRLARRIVVKLTAERVRVQERRGDISAPTKPDFDPGSLAETAAALKELGETLDQLLDKQSQAKAMAADDAAAASEVEKAIGEELKKADENSELDDEVESRLDDAQDAVAEAEKQLQDDADASATDRMQAIEAAEDALMQASVEVESQLSDIQQSLEASTPTENAAPSEGVSKNEPSSGTTRDLGSGATARGNHAIKSRSLTGEAWFTRLPPELQAIIRARTRRPAPRGYEERLREYFRSSD